MERAMGIAEGIGRKDRLEHFAELRDGYLRDAGPGRAATEKPVDNKS
jgi:hypothetical protein